ncbi:sulfatase family protein [Sinomicrobium weinanense]|uniref:Sulfatase n=1 Tax=Sinomicrobium weinanense TaxID=2842200 RepID=A0A926Q4K9_9FLAO|nr:sulfatase [Sinomicrobium weinanense]MBC9797005.1 sulfatase [Sinomicrobium weinanense]MBU3123297.1 sulfatase [Sinomicrobium weinanense]
MNIKATTFFLCFVLVLSSCKNGNPNTEEKPTEVKQPNIIFIMADDHAQQAISAYGHPIGQIAPTPNIDRIARNGAIFRNNFCTNSICGPSRAVILTGKHSHKNGFRMNGEKFDGSQPTLPKYLKKEGYKTAMIGKWHLNGAPTGFDYWDILKDQGNYYNPEFIHDGDTVVTPGYATDLTTEKTIKWLEENSKGDQPFFVMMHHKAPHRNWMPALRHAALYDSVKFPLPDNYFSKHEGQLAAQQQLMTVYKDMYEGHDLKMTVAEGSTELASNPWTNDFDRMSPEQRKTWDSIYQPKNDAMHRAHLTGKAMAEWKAQRYLQDYMATIASVDESVGQVLDYLEEKGLDENTIVVYTSDQGFYLGEHGWFDKRFMYEESLRMPLLIQYPGHIRKRTQINALTQNLDFAATFLDFAGAEIPDDFQGKSFKPLLEQKEGQEEFRNAIYYHYYGYPDFHMVKRHYGVRTKRYKLMHFYDDVDSWEMYDLETDPGENKNIYGDPKYSDIQQRLLVTLDSLQKAYGITEKEFEHADKKKTERAYEVFQSMRGEPME